MAVKGSKADGLSFAADATAAGAAGVVVSAGRGNAAQLAGAERVIEVTDERTALAVLARNLHGRIDERMPVVAVTGTNGKTTTCRITAEILECSGLKTGVLGTVSYRLGGEEIPAARTTPEAPDIHRYLERMRSAGCGACVMEVSSHALALRRVHGMGFAAAVFTNLTRDHLDYHGDMESYYQVKASLFTSLAVIGGRVPAAVVNTDDPYGRRLAASLAPAQQEGRVRLLTFGESPADFTMRSIQLEARGLSVQVQTPSGTSTLRSPLVGRPNAYNVTAAAAVATAMGCDWSAVTAGVAAAGPVAGRMERVAADAARDPGFSVIVDYAHTDDALRGLLETVRSFTAGRVIVVFGCGGDRDRSKRPLMGAHASRLAEVAFVTSDNPRSEKPEAIIEEILTGMEGGTAEIHVEPDRRKAIEAAIGIARPSDTVVIAGKGHETYQIIGDRVAPFDDRAVARTALARIHGAGEGDSHS